LHFTASSTRKAYQSRPGLTPRARGTSIRE
jgi:hypothetical protein